MGLLVLRSIFFRDLDDNVMASKLAVRIRDSLRSGQVYDSQIFVIDDFGVDRRCSTHLSLLLVTLLRLADLALHFLPLLLGELLGLELVLLDLKLFELLLSLFGRIYFSYPPHGVGFGFVLELS
jgi:hypothetical protein